MALLAFFSYLGVFCWLILPLLIATFAKISFLLSPVSREISSLCSLHFQLVAFLEPTIRNLTAARTRVMPMTVICVREIEFACSPARPRIPS